MKIYTKTGDGGTTGLSGGSRVFKSDPRIEAIGDVDELNAALGMCRPLASTSLATALDEIQSRLFDIGAELSCPPEGRIQFATIGEPHIEVLERSIDAQESSLEPLRSFILPGGSELASRIHLARTICRRSERRIVALNEIEPVRKELVQYLNRLSDWLFVSARTANAASGVQEVKWVSEDKHD